MKSQTVQPRSVASLVEAHRVLEGAGVPVWRSFPTAALADIDPFLLLDEMGPLELRAGASAGFPDHPHRGFETVTYMLEGAMEHRDSQGNHGVISAGGVQWMTAGSGVVHSEMPASAIQRNGGRIHGFQLWVNLPRATKMIPPRYQELAETGIPSAESPDGRVAVKVIAGEALGVRSALETQTPILYLHFVLNESASISQPVPPGFNVFAYVVSGEGRFGPGATPVHEGQAVIFGKDGDNVTLANPAGAKSPLSVLLIGGVPLDEPVARLGPFVMNTKAELYQAYEDFRSGRMGAIPAR